MQAGVDPGLSDNLNGSFHNLLGFFFVISAFQQLFKI